MTSIIIPDFIFKMFTQKILDINNIVINKLCEHYNLDKEEAHKILEKEMNMNFKLIGEDIEQIKIVKKHKKKDTEKKDDNKETNVSSIASSSTSSYCDARVFIANELIVKQCSRCKLDGLSFCKIHHKLNQKGKLKYGTIYEAKPDSISTEKLNMKVKRTIY
jgi:excinuclease UvrABC ATPase subunit